MTCCERMQQLECDPALLDGVQERPRADPVVKVVLDELADDHAGLVRFLGWDAKKADICRVLLATRCERQHCASTTPPVLQRQLL